MFSTRCIDSSAVTMTSLFHIFEIYYWNNQKRFKIDEKDATEAQKHSAYILYFDSLKRCVSVLMSSFAGLKKGKKIFFFHLWNFTRKKSSREFKVYCSNNKQTEQKIISIHNALSEFGILLNLLVTMVQPFSSVWVFFLLIFTHKNENNWRAHILNRKKT